MELIKRNKDRVLEPDMIEILYEEVLLYYENDDVNFDEFNLNKNPFLEKLQSKLGFIFIPDMKKAKAGNVDTFYFSNKSKRIKDWFYHLRNAFAHNRIFISSDGEMLIIQDQYQGKLTMYAEVSSFEKFVNIIRTIKSNKNNKRQ